MKKNESNKIINFISILGVIILFIVLISLIYSQSADNVNKDLYDGIDNGTRISMEKSEKNTHEEFTFSTSCDAI